MDSGPTGHNVEMLDNVSNVGPLLLPAGNNVKCKISKIAGVRKSTAMVVIVFLIFVGFSRHWNGI